MKKLYFLLAATLFMLVARGQENNSVIFSNPGPGAAPLKHVEQHPIYGKGPANDRAAAKTTSPGASYSDWYDLWDEMYDSGVSYSFYYEIYPDSNLLDTTGFYPAYQVFTHGMGMSFDPTDSAYYYHAYNPAYRVSEPFPYTLSYQLDSFFVPGEYIMYDATPGLTDSLIVEFIVTQNGGAPPDSGAYALIFNPADTIYRHCSPDETPRFATPRYFNATDDCIDPVLTTTTHQRYAFPQTAALAFVINRTKFGLTTPITVPRGKYLTAYVYFKSQVSYPLITSVEYANSYRLWAGEPGGYSVWFPQSAHNTATGYPGSHQTGLVATNQIKYSNTGFTFNAHNVLIPSYAYAHTGANPSSGFDVPEMAFHIRWVTPDTSLVAANEHSTPAEASVFPDPCDGLLNISVAGAGNDELSIILTDMMGRAVAVKEMGRMSNGIATFNTAGLPTGAYLCEIITNGQTTCKRAIIRH